MGTRRPRGLRVIAGSARGRRLVAPPGAVTRPMRDRVREALFAALDARGAVRGVAVLDLFGGSGALSVEALSRGARAAVVVERDDAAARAARENLGRGGFEASGRVVSQAVERVVAGPPPPEAPFGLVLCDPPLALEDDAVASLLRALVAPGWLAPQALVVVQRSREVPALPAGWEVTWERRYGDTLLAAVGPTADSTDRSADGSAGGSSADPRDR